MALQPDIALASGVLPAPLYRGLLHVFAQGISGCMLVGGTALAGYYAGHRRSDDLDLFTRDTSAQRATSLAVNSLREIGATIEPLQSSKQFNAVACSLDGHDFTAQVVLDPNLFHVGHGLNAQDGTVVADIDTLLAQKTATLVSRCSEKDLYDLLWLFERFRDLDLPTLLERGARIDGGVHAEAVLLSLVGTRLDRSACGFSRTRSADDVFDAIQSLKTNLEHGLDQLAQDQAAPRIGKLIRALK